MMKLAKNWTDVTIDMYQELALIQSENELTRRIKRLSILHNTDSEEIRQLPIPEFKKMVDESSWVTEKPNPDLNLTFEIDGKEYGMIPDLNFISTGEWADIENWKDQSIDNLHYICALLYRPITSRNGDKSKGLFPQLEYEIEPHKSEGFMKRAELFKKRLTIDRVFGAVVFFSSFGLNCIEIITDYLGTELN